MRYVDGEPQATGASGDTSRVFNVCTAIASGNQSNHESDEVQICLAWNRKRRAGMGPWVHGCQTAKVHRHHRAPLHKFERATARFAHVHIDLVGPLPASRGHTHLLTVIDRFTRWPEAIPLTQTDTASVARAFALHWIAGLEFQPTSRQIEGRSHIPDLASSRGIARRQSA